MKQLELQKHIASLTNEEFVAFLSELNMITLLTIEEELELIHRIRKGGSEAEQAKEVLAKSHLRFIYSVAKKYKHLSLSLQELLVSGITGLIKASEKFDETRGFKFTSYAVWWIRQSMFKSIMKHDAKDKQTELIVLFSKRQMLCIQKDEDIDPYVDNGLTSLAASNKDEELSLKNTHLFYRNADHILTDSRMFFAPVLIQNGMTYKGAPGSQYPTLGMYIEWWLKCKVDVTKDAEGNDALTYRIVGNPLTGTNRCKCVYPDGHYNDITHESFLPMWSMFQKISKRYHEAKVLFETYTLEEVIDILSGCN